MTCGMTGMVDGTHTHRYIYIYIHMYMVYKTLQIIGYLPYQLVKLVHDFFLQQYWSWSCICVRYGIGIYVVENLRKPWTKDGDCALGPQW